MYAEQNIKVPSPQPNNAVTPGGSALFEIDVRSLACFRILLALLILIDLAIRIGDLNAMYSEQGVMPLSLIQDYFQGTWRWSLFWVSGSIYFQCVLFLLTAIFVFALFLGFHSRIASVGCWVLIASLYNRAPFTVSGADTLLVIFLFWGMFLPLGACWSWDAMRRDTNSQTNTVVLSGGTVAILIQIALLYFCTGCFKAIIHANPGLLLENALQWADYNRPMGNWLVAYPNILWFLSWSTIVLEIVAPWLLFSPWKTNTLRLLVFAGLCSLHIGIELTLSVALFSYIAFAGLTLFLPTAFWNTLDRLFTRSHESQRVRKQPTQRMNDLPFALNALCVLLIAFVVTVNVLGFLERSQIYAKPQLIQRIGELTMLNQKWSMFASLQRRQTRIVAYAVLNNGQEIDILRSQTHLVGPQRLVNHPNHRWVKYFQMITRSKTPLDVKQRYARWLFDQWNDRHGELEQIRELSLRRVRQVLPGEENLTHTGTETLAVIHDGSLRVEETIRWQGPWRNR